jgi:hypothetical protein
LLRTAIRIISNGYHANFDVATGPHQVILTRKLNWVEFANACRVRWQGPETGPKAADASRLEARRLPSPTFFAMPSVPIVTIETDAQRAHDERIEFVIVTLLGIARVTTRNNEERARA